jgi:hypothetical protein
VGAPRLPKRARPGRRPAGEGDAGRLQVRGPRFGASARGLLLARCCSAGSQLPKGRGALREAAALLAKQLPAGCRLIQPSVVAAPASRNPAAVSRLALRYLDNDRPEADKRKDMPGSPFAVIAQEIDLQRPAGGDPPQIYITGHSLGGALATMFSAALALRGHAGEIGACYTYGQPRVGDFRFMAKYESLMQYKDTAALHAGNAGAQGANGAASPGTFSSKHVRVVSSACRGYAPCMPAALRASCGSARSRAAPLAPLKRSPTKHRSRARRPRPAGAL